MTVRWGVLGAGWIAQQAMLPAIAAATDAECVAIAARELTRAQAYAQRFGVSRAYGSYDELLADERVDAVYVGLANDGHLSWTLAALAAGKHVLCEKPLGLTAAEVDQMADAAGREERVLVEASMYRWHPRIRLAQRLVADGAIGEVVHVSAGFTFDGVPAGNYRLDAARGGGATYDVGCYAISAALWAFGSSPRSVTARRWIGESGVDLTLEAILEFDAGNAEVHASINETARQWLTVTGSAGSLEFPEQPFTSWHAESALVVNGVERFLPGADPYRLMVEQVSAAIEGGDSWVLPLVDSRGCAAALDAVFATAATHAG